MSNVTSLWRGFKAHSRLQTPIRFLYRGQPFRRSETPAATIPDQHQPSAHGGRCAEMDDRMIAIQVQTRIPLARKC